MWLSWRIKTITRYCVMKMFHLRMVNLSTSILRNIMHCNLMTLPSQKYIILSKQLAHPKNKNSNINFTLTIIYNIIQNIIIFYPIYTHNLTHFLFYTLIFTKLSIKIQLIILFY